jgi:hypothetical protein
MQDPSDVFCCGKTTHITIRCVWPNQLKPVMRGVCLGSPELGFFVAQHAETEQLSKKASKLCLILVVSGNHTPAMLFGGLTTQFNWIWTLKVVAKGKILWCSFHYS